MRRRRLQSGWATLPGNDLASMIGAPELAAPAPAPAPVQAAPAAPPPLPAEPDASLLARAAVAEGDQNNPDSWRNVAGVILNRAQKSGQSVASVLSQPGQFESYGNGHIQSVDPNSPAYKAALQTVQGVKAGDVPYDSFYQPQIVAQRGVTPPFDPSKGTKIGTQLFGSGGYSAPAQGADLAGMLLTTQERAAMASDTGPAVDPSNPAAAQPGPGHVVNFGPQFAHVSAAAESKYAQIGTQRGGLGGHPGSPTLPWYIPPGQVAPATAGDHWVDINGQEHVNPGGAAERALNMGQGAVQAAADVGGSLTKLTGGVFGIGTPAQALQTTSAEERNYALAHHGDPYAQTGRFLGQAAPAIAASAAVPEIELPAALGGLGRIASGVATNALRGVAATAPSVGANPAPVAQQLATGALAGVVAPAVTGALGKAGSALTGLGRTVNPEVAALADTAQSKYGLDLKSGQVMAANGDRKAGYAFSNMQNSSQDARDANLANHQSWQRGVTSTYGDPSGDVSDGALQASRDRIGGVMNDVADRTNIVDAQPVLKGIQSALSDAKSVLPEGEVTPLKNLSDEIASVVQPDGSISGASYQALIRKGGVLDTAIKRGASPYPSMFKDALDDALQASASPEDVQTLQNARWQYKNLMTVAKLAPKAQDTPLGLISPSLLSGAVNTNFKNRAFQGAGDLGELAKIGQTFLKEPPQSGTIPRGADLAGPLGIGAGIGALSEIGLNLANHPDSGISALASMGLATGGKMAANALKQNRIGGSASNIIANSLPGSPGTVSALSGLKSAAKAVEIPLSALAGVRGIGALQPAGAQ
jgi:hypothetical protein